MVVFLLFQVCSSWFCSYLRAALASSGPPPTPPSSFDQTQTFRLCWRCAATSAARASPAACAPVRTVINKLQQTHLTAEIWNKYVEGVFNPVGVFMEKPHQLFSHASSSGFRFSTHQHGLGTTASTTCQSQLKLKTNQTGKRSALGNPLHSFKADATRFFFHFICFFRPLNDSIYIKAPPRRIHNSLPFLPQYQRPIPVENVQPGARGGVVIPGQGAWEVSLMSFCWMTSCI